MTDEQPTIDPTPNPDPTSDSAPFISPSSPALMPKQIGKFRIKKLIATGGMGAVYQGVQEQPRRTVAIKLMKSGVTSKSALRRFEYESQLLARLKHPGIAAVYDAGTHEAHDGAVPYFVMEYIAGAKRITDYVRDKKLSTRERLKLFTEAAEAVHHGHTKGIIHRDLKPDNILVDSHGRVKVIDFGVARATDSDLAVTTLQTDIGQLIGTVQYMSPEQVEADPEDLDTRSDVYALGVILYQMLCERLPYDVSELKVYDATRVVREQEAMKLSAVNTALRGDIETITLKALEKDRERRYQTAEALAADIQRYLNDEPITAHPPSVTYQLSVFARRHKTMVTGAAAVFLALLLGVIASTALWLEAREARDTAETEAAKARQAVAVLTEMVGAANPAASKGPDYTILQMLDDFATDLDRRLAGQPEVEADVRSSIGQAYWELRLTDKAETEFERALALRQEAFGPEHAKVASSLVDLSRVAYQQGPSQRQQMEDLASRGFAIHEKLGPPTLEMAEALRWMGIAKRREEEGANRLRRTVEIARQAADGDESQVLANALHDLSVALSSTGAFDEAVEHTATCTWRPRSVISICRGRWRRGATLKKR
ncbi:MAG: serine/threonine protein kinase [Planctomycetota bacterium]|jgi:non-specific serine/threonine protein kinase/serine/threonine-protein kinase